VAVRKSEPSGAEVKEISLSRCHVYVARMFRAFGGFTPSVRYDLNEPSPSNAPRTDTMYRRLSPWLGGPLAGAQELSGPRFLPCGSSSFRFVADPSPKTSSSPLSGAQGGPQQVSKADVKDKPKTTSASHTRAASGGGATSAAAAEIGKAAPRADAYVASASASSSLSTSTSLTAAGLANVTGAADASTENIDNVSSSDSHGASEGAGEDGAHGAANAAATTSRAALNDDARAHARAPATDAGARAANPTSPTKADATRIGEDVANGGGSNNDGSGSGDGEGSDDGSDKGGGGIGGYSPEELLQALVLRSGLLGAESRVPFIDFLDLSNFRQDVYEPKQNRDGSVSLFDIKRRLKIDVKELSDAVAKIVDLYIHNQERFPKNWYLSLGHETDPYSARHQILHCANSSGQISTPPYNELTWLKAAYIYIDRHAPALEDLVPKIPTYSKLLREVDCCDYSASVEVVHRLHASFVNAWRSSRGSSKADDRRIKRVVDGFLERLPISLTARILAATGYTMASNVQPPYHLCFADYANTAQAILLGQISDLPEEVAREPAVQLEFFPTLRRADKDHGRRQDHPHKDKRDGHGHARDGHGHAAGHVHRIGAGSGPPSAPGRAAGASAPPDKPPDDRLVSFARESNIDIGKLQAFVASIQQTRTCYNCGKEGHDMKECPAPCKYDRMEEGCNKGSQCGLARTHTNPKSSHDGPPSNDGSGRGRGGGRGRRSGGKRGGKGGGPPSQ
jgi:hypothetical protein